MRNYEAELGRLLRDAAIKRVEEAADEAWKEAALEAVRQAALTLPQFTTDAVVPLIPTTVKTHDLRALGPVMRRAATLGWIVQAEVMPIPTARRHMTPLLVWRSLLCTM